MTENDARQAAPRKQRNCLVRCWLAYSSFIDYWYKELYEGEDYLKYVFLVVSSLIIIIRVIIVVTSDLEAKKSMVYLIHSIVILLDLVLMHFSVRNIKTNVISIISVLIYSILFILFAHFMIEIVETLSLATFVTVYQSFNHTHQKEELLIEYCHAYLEDGIEGNMEAHADHVRRFLEQDVHKARIRHCIEDFFEDSSGILYTSFFGLLLDEIMAELVL